jgi:hypothetical protein
MIWNYCGWWPVLSYLNWCIVLCDIQRTMFMTSTLWRMRWSLKKNLHIVIHCEYFVYTCLIRFHNLADWHCCVSSTQSSSWWWTFLWWAWQFRLWNWRLKWYFPLSFLIFTRNFSLLIENSFTPVNHQL